MKVTRARVEALEKRLDRLQRSAEITVLPPKVQVDVKDWTPTDHTLPQDATLTVTVPVTLDGTTLLVASTDDLVAALMPIIETRIRAVLAHVTVKEWG